MNYRRLIAVAAALPVVCVIAAGTAALIVVEVVSGIWRAEDRCPKQETKPKRETTTGDAHAIDWN